MGAGLGKGAFPTPWATPFRVYFVNLTLGKVPCALQISTRAMPMLAAVNALKNPIPTFWWSLARTFSFFSPLLTRTSARASARPRRVLRCRPRLAEGALVPWAISGGRWLCLTKGAIPWAVPWAVSCSWAHGCWQRRCCFEFGMLASIRTRAWKREKQVDRFGKVRWNDGWLCLIELQFTGYVFEA